MKRFAMSTPLRVGALVAAGLLAGCTSVNIDQALQQTNQATPEFTQGQLELSRSAEQRQARQALSEKLLAKPLSMTDAVQLALANSATVQSLLAASWADMAAASQTGRIANPVFSFERTRIGDEIELARSLSFGLLELLTLLQRQALAQDRLAQARTRLSTQVVEQVSQVRQAWVRAVAAQQTAQYAAQVNRAAQASAELAKRMQQAGNFSKLERARQHAFYADAVAQLALAQHAAAATREALVRALGLDDAQAARLQLPERLPDLPAVPRVVTAPDSQALAQRLDVQLARQQLDAVARAQGLGSLGSLVDVELGLRHDTVSDQASGSSASRNGYGLAIRLPLFDGGGHQRAALDAQSLLAVNRLEATVRDASSQLREAWSAYRTTHDLARHYRDEIVPLRKTMAEENLLRYNGMLIGVFELLADTREQIGSVIAAINAEQQFWLADAALSAALIGSPMVADAPTMARPSGAGSSAGGH